MAHRRNANRFGARRRLKSQSVRLQRLQMRATGNQRDVESGLEQAATDDRSDRASADTRNPPCSVPPTVGRA